MTSFFSIEELETLGLSKYGRNVLISRKCSLYGTEKMVLGDNVRIDDFCILSGNILLGNYIHISAYSAFYAGKYSIKCQDYSTISSRCMIYAESDDYSGESLTNPMIPEKYRKTYGGSVNIECHVIIGSGCTILPNVTISEGAAVGAMSLVIRDLPGWNIYGGVPCYKIKERSKKILELASLLERDVVA